MKTKLLMLSLTLVFVSAKSFANCGGKGGGGSEVGELADKMLPLTITTSPPTGTTSLLSCAEVNPEMVLREATMVVEENKFFNPSFLGTYAEKNNMEIHDAAKYVLENGVK